jgi:hypothetical protein
MMELKCIGYKFGLLVSNNGSVPICFYSYFFVCNLRDELPYILFLKTNYKLLHGFDYSFLFPMEVTILYKNNHIDYVL